MWKLEYGFLVAFHRNYDIIFSRFRTILERNRINIVSSAVARTHARSLHRHWSIASSNIDCSRTTPDIDEPPFQFIHTMDFSLVDRTLRDNPDLVIHRTEIWAVRRPQIGRSSTVARACAVCRWTVLLEHNVITRHSAYCWQQFLSQKHITIVCSVNFCVRLDKK